MNGLYVAQDIAPSNISALLAAEQKKRGHSVNILVGKGKVFPASLDDVRNAVKEANLVVVGLSSSEKLAQPEIAACEVAMKSGVPFGFIGDTYHCYERARDGSYFGPFRHKAKFYFAINEKDASAARSVFPEAISVNTGNPTWEDYAFPKFTRAEVRVKYGIADDEILVLTPGSKSPAVNTIIWGMLIDALTVVPKSKLFISYHPGDRTPYAVDPDKVHKFVEENLLKRITENLSQSDIGKVFVSALEDASTQLNIYTDLKTFSSVPVEFLPNDVKTSHFLPGADVVVEWGSSIAIEAAHQRIPVISVATEVGKKRMFSSSKTEKWEPVELGVALQTGCNSHYLSESIKTLTAKQSQNASDLRKRQADVYPKPQAQGSSIKMMADTLEQLLK